MLVATLTFDRAGHTCGSKAAGAGGNAGRRAGSRGPGTAAASHNIVGSKRGRSRHLEFRERRRNDYDEANILNIRLYIDVYVCMCICNCGAQCIVALCLLCGLYMCVVGWY